MQNRTDAELAVVGAAWWTEHLRNRPTPPKLGVAVVDAAASLLTQLPRPPEDQVAAFRQHLEAEIVNALASSSGWLIVSMDYDPDAILRRALEAAGMDAGAGLVDLPWKTKMEFHGGRITVSSLGKPAEHI